MVLITCISAFSQEEIRFSESKQTNHIPKNELKFNLGTTTHWWLPEISYERILNKDFSVGLSTGSSLISRQNMPFFSFTPYGRWFLGGNSTFPWKYGDGFFIEANLPFLWDEVEKQYDPNPVDPGSGDIIDYNTKEEYFFTSSIGLAVGWKFRSKKNWIAEIYVGGNHFFTIDSYYLRMGIAVEKRF